MAGEDVLQRIIDVINSVEDAVTRPGSLQLNESLNHCLLARLLETRRVLQTESVHNSKERIGEPLQELHRIVTEADSDIVQACCSRRWVPAAIQQAENKESFFEVLRDLHWCTGVVQSATLKALRESDDSIISEPEIPLSVEHTPTADPDEEKFIRRKVEEAATRDKQAFESKLNQFLSEPTDEAGVNNDDVAIAKHLKSWLAGHRISGDLTDIRQGELIGRGVSGPVFSCTWHGLTFAEKGFTSGEGARASFKEEAEVMRYTRHSNVVKLVAKDDANCKLLLELMDGSLRELIVQASERNDGAPFRLPVTVDILLQISKAMLFLHRKRVAHRDIKSGNILYSRGRERGGYIHVKVADFGLAKVKLMSMMAMTVNTGTREWTAPELIKISRDRVRNFVVDAEGHEVPVKEEVTVKHALRADVYSFGITCFELVTGQINPYRSYCAPDAATVRPPNLAHRVAVEGLRPALPHDLPPEYGPLVYLMQICWAQDPSHRPTFAYIYKFLLGFKAALLTGSPFSYQEWKGEMDSRY